MKKIIFVAAVALALCSCAKTELTGVDAGEMIIGASMEAYPSGTKAALADAGTFTWQTGDAIGVATGDVHSVFTLKTGAGTASATFSAIYQGTLGSYATYPADIFVSDSKITIPTSRNWSEGNTNCSMFGSLTNGNVAFKQLGGVVKVTLKGVPAEAKKFVFSTPGKKITGEFNIQTETGENGNKYIATSDDSNDANSSYTLNFKLTQAQDMAFYIPLPCGTYPKFAFKVLGADVVLNEFEGSSQQVVNRKDILIMPTLTIGTITGDGDDAEQGAISKKVPAGTQGNYRLPVAEKVILNFEGVDNPTADDVINLVYDGDSHLPSQLWLRVASGKKVNVSGNLQHTTVVFDQGDIDYASLTTAQNTFKIIAPAKISKKLVVMGGNVEISGEITGSNNVKAIEVKAGATADGTSAPVQITIAEDATVGTPEPDVEGGITTSANVVIVNNTMKKVNVTVPTEVQETVQVASAGTGQGEVTKNGAEVTTKPAAAIGTQNFITLKDAVNAIPEGNGQTVTINILKDIVLKASETLTINKNNVVLDGNGKTIALDENDEALNSYTDSKYGQFKMITVSGKNVTLKNMTLDSKEYRGASLATTVGGENVVYENITYQGNGCAHYYGTNGNGLITFKNCNINTCGYGVHSDTATGGIVIEKCKIHGWNAFGSAVAKVTIKDSKFYGAEDFKNGTLAACSIYCPTTFTNCTFSKEFHDKNLTYRGLFMSAKALVSLNGCSVDEGELYSMVRIDDSDWPTGAVVAIDATGDATTGFTDGTFVAKQASDIKVRSGYACHEIEGKPNVYGIREVEAVAKIGSVKYETLDAAIAAAKTGDEVSIVKADTYKVPAIPQNITVIGGVEGVVFDCTGGGSVASIPKGATFKNVTMTFGQVGYTGFYHAGHIYMIGCTFNGLFFSYGDMTFTDCTFNQSTEEYNMWDYGQNLTYTNCTFNSVGKFINVYNEGNGNWKLTVEGCTFNSTKKNKAAINIKASCGLKNLGWDVTINNCKVNDPKMFPGASGDATSKLYVGSPIWQVDDRTDSSLKANIVKVTVDGVVVYGSKEAE